LRSAAVYQELMEQHPQEAAELALKLLELGTDKPLCPPELLEADIISKTSSM